MLVQLMIDFIVMHALTASFVVLMKWLSLVSLSTMYNKSKNYHILHGNWTRVNGSLRSSFPKLSNYHLKDRGRTL